MGKNNNIAVAIQSSQPLLVEKVKRRAPLTGSGLRGRAVQLPSTTFHRRCLALLKFDAEDRRIGGRAGREQTLDVSQRSWMPARIQQRRNLQASFSSRHARYPPSGGCQVGGTEAGSFVPLAGLEITKCPAAPLSRVRTSR